MKKLNGIVVIIVTALLAFVLSGSAKAFHSGGVGECEGCHAIHNSREGAQMTINALPAGTTNSYLLKGQDASSTCLNCHQHAGDTGPTGYHISTADADMPAGTAPLQLSPGGDFGWMKKTYSWVPRAGAATEYSYGERHGHNVIAADFGYVADTTLTAAPGGTYGAENLSCISCHDPHGKHRRLNNGLTRDSKPIKASGSYNNSPNPDANSAVGVYRLLGGKNYVPYSLSSVVSAFVNDPPVAVAPSDYNRAESSTQTRVAYGRGMSEWCANCHQNTHNESSGGNLSHPAGNNAKLQDSTVNNYNAYKKTGDLSGISAKSYLSLVPFEEGVADHTTTSYTRLKGNAVSNDSQPNGPNAANANVSCMSCHRAHASGWDSIMRFPVGNEFMTVADGTGTPIYPDPTANPAQAMGRTTAEFQKALYEHPATNFAAYQRALCNKCHAKD